MQVGRGDKTQSWSPREGAPDQEIFVLFLFLNGEKTLSGFKCDESIERQRLKAERREINQQIFLKTCYMLSTVWSTGDPAKDKICGLRLLVNG